MGLPLPSSDTPLDSPGPVSGNQATQVSQPTISIPKKMKIERYNRLDSIPTHKAHGVIPGNDIEMATEPQL